MPVSYTHLDVYKRQAMVGGIGIAPGANINYRTGHAIFEATHGTAPNIAGKDIVNPCCLLYTSDVYKRQGWARSMMPLSRLYRNCIRV